MWSRRLIAGAAAMLAAFGAVGGWYYRAEFDDLSEIAATGRPVRTRGSAGVYVLADQLVHREAAPSNRQTRAFGELGAVDSRVNRFGFYAGGGVVLSGLLPAFEYDELGLAVALARNGPHFIELQRENERPSGGVAVRALVLTARGTSRLVSGVSVRIR